MSILAAIPFHSGDVALARKLLEWCKLLGRCPNHDAVLVADAGTQWSECVDLLTLANQVFRLARLVTTDVSVAGWPAGANSLFVAAAKYAREQTTPWLFLEPDAIPLKPQWLELLELEYQKISQLYLGHIYLCQTPGLPGKLMSGVAVYPFNTIVPEGTKAFDVELAHTMVHSGKHTNLIQHIWGEPNNPPVFAERNVPATNVFCLRQLNNDAVIFHRNKDGSLIRLIKRKLGICGERDFVVIIPFCSKDAKAQLKNVSWMADMGQPKTHDAILSFDTNTPRKFVDSIGERASQAFKSVNTFAYPPPVSTKFPRGANHAFQQIAIHMYEQVKRPWLFLESDEIPVIKDWLIKLQDEYDRCGKPLMGHKVAHLGHMNGGGIYPENFPEYSQAAMMADEVAWDWDMRHDIAPHLHPANHLIEQCTNLLNGVPDTHYGIVPTFKNQADLDRLVLPGIVLFHRCKDGTLIDRMRERMKP